MTTKILVIEDAHALRKDILEMLSFENYDVRGAENGLLGVQAAREYRPDLIICDIMMPELDGYGVLAELQKDKTQATTPFIFLTARTDKGDVRQGMELGANDYLTKPFTATELINAVKTQLDKWGRIVEQSQTKLEDLRENIILALPHELRTPISVRTGCKRQCRADFLAGYRVRDRQQSRYNYYPSPALSLQPLYRAART